MLRRIFFLFAMLMAAAAIPSTADAQRNVLVYAPGGRSAIDDLSTNVPSVMAGPARGVFTFANAAMWASLTTAQFASYNAIWIDGGGCGGALSIMDAATANRLTWSAAITGHFEIIGSDSDFHIGSSLMRGSRKFLENSYHYVTSGAGTGLFLSTSCLYASAPMNTQVPWLQGIGDFRVTGDSCVDTELLEPGSATHPVEIGITPPSSTLCTVAPCAGLGAGQTDLSWGCFTHSHFNQHPPSFQRIFSLAPVGPGRGVVIVNDRGGCVIDADCLPGQFCNRDASGGDPTCRITHGNGTECTTGADCTSGICTEGVCCNATCSGQCESCRNAGRVGLCSATTGAPIGTRAACVGFGSTCGGRCDGMNRTECTFPPTSLVCVAASCTGGVATTAANCNGRGACGTPTTAPCNPYICGVSACLTMCATDSDCATGLRCTAGACVTRIPAGMGCTVAAECASGNCVDGVCCNAACNGQCEACDVPGSLGTCTAVRGAPHAARRACGGDGTCAGTCDGTVRTMCNFPNDQTMCGMPMCTGGHETGAAVCDAHGACTLGRQRDCGLFACGPAACRTSCDTDVECVAGAFCSGGMCVTRQPPGSTCTMAAQCASGNCVDGVCCNTACNGQCEACDVAGSAGACTPVMGAPHGMRIACGGTGPCAGTCDGAARTDCAYPGSSMECRAASCTSGQASSRGTCNGSGACTTATMDMCAPYTCDNTACRVSCTVATDCIMGFRCEMGRCVPPGNLGQPCMSNDQCGMGGVCSGGVCCNQACDGACQSCVLPGHPGTCTPLPANTQISDAGNGRLCSCDGVSGACRNTPDAGAPDVQVMDSGPQGDPVTLNYRGGGCGCSTPGRASGNAALGLAIAALALASTRRRRR